MAELRNWNFLTMHIQAASQTQSVEPLLLQKA
jgi:hypothetical protein